MTTALVRAPSIPRMGSTGALAEGAGCVRPPACVVCCVHCAQNTRSVPSVSGSVWPVGPVALLGWGRLANPAARRSLPYRHVIRGGRVNHQRYRRRSVRPILPAECARAVVAPANPCLGRVRRAAAVYGALRGERATPKTMAEDSRAVHCPKRSRVDEGSLEHAEIAVLGGVAASFRCILLQGRPHWSQHIVHASHATPEPPPGASPKA